jgi:proteasome lid subunit RPN8/RPN11
MKKRPELPPSSDNFPGKQEQNLEQRNKIIWQERDDVYRPICKKLEEFKREREINDEDRYQVYIKKNALESLKKHLSSNTKVEQGGILLGHAYQDSSSEKIYVEITAAIAAPATIGSGAHLEFTPSSWIGIMDYAKAKHTQENIVGWYHSHPNIGVFMSGTDMRTQRAFFNHPWCLSIVYDPVREDIGYFLGKDAKKVQPHIYSLKKQLPVNKEEVENSQTLADKIEDEKATSRKFSATKKSGLIAAIGLSFLNGFLFAEALNHIFKLDLTKLDFFSFTPKKNDWQIELKSMSVAEFDNINQVNPQYLRYSLIQKQRELGKGTQVETLLILNQETEAIKDLKLTFDEINLDSDRIIDNNKSLLSIHIDGATNSKTVPVKFQSTNLEGMIFFLYSYSLEGNKKKIHKGDSIYIPRQITYFNNQNEEVTSSIQNYVITDGK